MKRPVESEEQSSALTIRKAIIALPAPQASSLQSCPNALPAFRHSPKRRVKALPFEPRQDARALGSGRGKNRTDLAKDTIALSPATRKVRAAKALAFSRILGMDRDDNAQFEESELNRELGARKAYTPRGEPGKSPVESKVQVEIKSEECYAANRAVSVLTKKLQREREQNAEIRQILIQIWSSLDEPIKNKLMGEMDHLQEKIHVQQELHKQYEMGQELLRNFALQKKLQQDLAARLDAYEARRSNCV